jgi:hypothetical protein
MSELRDSLTGDNLAACPRSITPLPFPQLHHTSYFYHNVPGRFMCNWFSVSEPFVMEPDTFKHDFDQVVVFMGGDATQMDKLGGVCEFWHGDKEGNTEKFIITEPMTFFIPAGHYHCPIKFLEVFDKNKPILFQDIALTAQYKKWLLGSDQALDMQGNPLRD